MRAEVTIDIHESDSGIFEQIKSLGIDATVRSLHSGDVVIAYDYKSVGIEIKRNQDFTNSLYSGRLKAQIVKLYDNHHYPILIIEGWKPYFTDKDTEQTIEIKMDKFNQSVRTLNRRIATYETKDQTATVELISEIVSDMENDSLLFMKRPIIVEKGLRAGLGVLTGLPQISKERGELLLDKYGTARKALSKVSEWDDMKIGLTEQRLDAIRKEWEGE